MNVGFAYNAFDEKRTEELRKGAVVMLGTIFYDAKKERLERPRTAK
jgi:hypothetical protein